MNLKEFAGIDIELDETTGKLTFPGISSYPGPTARTLDDARDYYLDPNAEGPKELYWMYRDIALPQDRAELEAESLRYDITVLAHGIIGQEYVKTIGHYHPRPETHQESYPEIYEVLYGKATYFLQDENLADVVIVEAEPGTHIFIPPGYGHITINTSSKFLVMSNIVSTKFASVYGLIKEHRGGCYYCLKSEEGPLWVPNDRYWKHPAIRFYEPWNMPILSGVFGPLYTNLVQDPKRFTCMNYPEVCPSLQ